MSNNGSDRDVPRTPPPQRVKSAGAASVTGVLQRTHGFFSTIKSRLSRARSKERGRKSPADADFDHGQSDYAADTSDHSCSSTPTQSPRHRGVAAVSDSPLARTSHHTYTGSKTDSIKVTSTTQPRLERQSSYARASLDSLSKDDTQRQRELELRKHSFFQLKVHSLRGQGLVAMDKSGE